MISLAKSDTGRENKDGPKERHWEGLKAGFAQLRLKWDGRGGSFLVYEYLLLRKTASMWSVQIGMPRRVDRFEYPCESVYLIGCKSYSNKKNHLFWLKSEWFTEEKKLKLLTALSICPKPPSVWNVCLLTDSEVLLCLYHASSTVQKLNLKYSTKLEIHSYLLGFYVWTEIELWPFSSHDVRTI